MSSEPEREEARFEQLHREMYPRVLAYAMRRTMDRAAADEIASEALVVAWRRRAERSGDQLSWLLGIARGLLANHYRGERRRVELERRLAREWSQRAPDPADEVADREQMIAALARLPEADRELLILLSWDRLDRREAARVLGCSRAALAVRLHRARRRLEAAQLEADAHGERPSLPRAAEDRS